MPLTPLVPRETTGRFRLALAKARRKRGLTQIQAGEQLDLTMGLQAAITRREDCVAWVGKIERSMQLMPEIEVLNELFKLYRVTWVEILRESGVPDDLIG